MSLSNSAAFFIELVLVFGGVLALALWEFRSLRRWRARDAEALKERARHAERQERPDRG